MLNVKLYKNNSGDFHKAAIEIADQSLLSVFIRGILVEMEQAEKIIQKFKGHENNNLSKKNQEKFDQLEELLNKFDKPQIVKNEKAELIKRYKKMNMVYQKEDDYAIENKIV